MVVLGIDPSSHLGLAVVRSGKEVLHTEEAHYPKLSGSAQAGILTQHVFDLHEKFKPDLVVIETMIVGHPSSAIPVIRLGSILRYFLWQRDIKALEVNPGHLKKFVVGTGNAKKEEMMMMVLKHWGHQSKTNNTADAVGLAMFGLCYLGEVFTQRQSMLVKAVTKSPSWCN